MVSNCAGKTISSSGPRLDARVRPFEVHHLDSGLTGDRLRSAARQSPLGAR